MCGTHTAQCVVCSTSKIQIILKKKYTVWYDCSCELIIFEISNALWSKSHVQLSEKQTERMETNEKKKLKCGKNKTEYEMWFS